MKTIALLFVVLAFGVACPTPPEPPPVPPPGRGDAGPGSALTTPPDVVPLSPAAPMPLSKNVKPR